MSRARLLAGWIVVVLIAGLVSVSTLVVVREAVGGGTVVDALSQADVATQYAIAQTRANAGAAPSASTPTPGASGPSGPTGSSATHPSRSGTAPRASGPAARPSSPAKTPGGDGRASGSPSPGAGSASAPPTSVTRVLTSAGGSVVARCTGSGGSGSVYLVSWSPAQGYAVDGVRRGPGEEAEIEFESASHSVSVTFHCTTSGPVQSVENDDGGGDDGPGDT